MAVIAPFLVSTNAEGQNSTKAQARAQSGISLARTRHWAEAEQELRAAIQADPYVAAYHAQLGSVLGLQGKWKDALTSVQKAAELDPENLSFQRETAALQWQLGLLDLADKNLRYVLEKNPEDPKAVLLLGLVSDARKDYANGAKLLRSQFVLAVSEPDWAVALFDSTLRSGQKANLEELVEVLRSHATDKLWASAIGRCAQIAAMEGDPSISEVLFALIPDDGSGRPGTAFQFAKLLYIRGQVSHARELLLQLEKRGAASADSEALLGNCFESEHQVVHALQAYQLAIEMDPLQVNYYEELISLQLDLGNISDAIALANRALAVAPNDARPWVWKGNADLRKSAFNDAMDSYIHARQLDGSNAEAILGLGGVQFLMGQSDAAIAAYRIGIAQFPNDARFYIACAGVIVASPDSIKRQMEAKGLLEKAVKLAPQSAEAHYQLGQLALQQNRLNDAERELSVSIQSEPDRSRSHFALSLVYQRLGRTDAAAKQFAIYHDLKRAQQSATIGANMPAEKR